MAAQTGAALLLTSLLITLATIASSNTEGDILHLQRRRGRTPNNVLQSWDPTLFNPCTWLHVTCNSDNPVTRLNLVNTGISGTLIPELGGLRNLRYL
ncbi:hypothetical protein ZWY2020_026910 [Hordeum vulgare]|nr:hypothetical protein ZWY2020_026910 [Hordeum vulgare]